MILEEYYKLGLVLEKLLQRSMDKCTKTGARRKA